MRRRFCIALALVAAAAPGAAQQQLTRSTVDGGGGRSVSARYVMTGTIGQPDAEPLMQRGRYRLGGGFWTALPSDGIFLDGFEGE
jgi:hypothetical protein